VLDRLFEDERLHVAAVSGTSAGAMNAVALAGGMARGGPAGARKCLEEFWSATSAAAQYSPIRRSLVDIFLGNWSLDASPAYIFMDHLSRVFSPYDLNPSNFNPLRDVLARCVDFDSVNDQDGLKLFLAATNVRTGKPKIFRQPGIQLDSVMASACLPFLFKAVEIDGEAYWARARARRSARPFAASRSRQRARDRKFADSPLEQTGFEPLVPLRNWCRPRGPNDRGSMPHVS
jgi:NTE family protein